MCMLSSIFAFTLFLWTELIGFDNTAKDYGVDEYLSRMVRKPDGISLLLNSDQFFRNYDRKLGNFKLLPDCSSYWARPNNAERYRQDWTTDQLKGLVATLKDRGIEVYAAFFDDADNLPTTDANMKTIAVRLTDFLVDFGFSGLHCADGYAPPRYGIPSDSTPEERIERAYKAAERYAANIRVFVDHFHPKGLKIYMNTCWARDPYEAMYRYGVDYRLLAKTGVDGFIVESSAAAQELEGWTKTAASATDKSTAMLIRLRGAAPDLKFVMLHAINDSTEQWSALRHSPSATRSEALAMGTVFYNGKRALDGYLACLSDGIRPEEWKELDKSWSLSFTDIVEPVGVHVVWSDRAFDKEFRECVLSYDASSQTLLTDLIDQGLIVHSGVSVDYAVAHPDLPILVLNPEFFPEDELAALRCRSSKLYEFGRGARPPYFSEYVPCADRKQPASRWYPLPENRPTVSCTRSAAMNINWRVDPYEFRTEHVKSWGVKLPDGRLGIFARNDQDVYTTAEFIIHDCISDVKVHTDFPVTPPGTVLNCRIAPRDTVFFSVKEVKFPLPKQEEPK